MQGQGLAIGTPLCLFMNRIELCLISAYITLLLIASTSSLILNTSP